MRRQCDITGMFITVKQNGFFKSHISQRPPKVNFKMKSGRKGSFSQLWCSLLCSHHGPKGDKTYFTSRNLEIVYLLEQGCQTCGVEIYIFMWKGEFSLSPPLTFFYCRLKFEAIFAYYHPSKLIKSCPVKSHIWADSNKNLHISKDNY